jgi:hypothetical protein
MCLYLYAPEHQILISYFLERIYLSTFGSALLIVDLIVTNKSAEPIEEFEILVARNYASKIKEEDRETDFKYKKVWSATSEFRSHPKNLRNIFYDSCGNTISYDEDGNSVIIHLFNFSNPDTPVERKGRVIDGKVRAKAQSAWYKNLVLKDLDYSMLLYSFEGNNHLYAEESVAIRLVFNPKQPYIQSPTKRSWVKRAVLFSVFDALNFNYSFVGPYDVPKAFVSDIAQYRGRTDDRNLRNAAKELGSSIEEQLNNPESRVTIPKMLLHIAPRKLRLLHSFLVHGDLKPLGRQPRYYSDDPFPSRWLGGFPFWRGHWRKRVYVWIADLNKKDGKAKIEAEPEKAKIIADHKQLESVCSPRNPNKIEKSKTGKSEGELSKYDLGGSFHLNFAAFSTNNYLRGFIFFIVLISAIRVVLDFPHITDYSECASSAINWFYRLITSTPGATILAIVTIVGGIEMLKRMRRKRKTLKPEADNPG